MRSSICAQAARAKVDRPQANLGSNLEALARPWELGLGRRLGKISGIAVLARSKAQFPLTEVHTRREMGMSSKNSSPPAALARAIVLVLAGSALLLDPSSLGAAQRFRRADSNSSGALDIGDAVFTLGFLFRGAPDRIPCEDAADSNDDGKLDISDPVHSLGYLFLGGPGPPPPFGPASSDCGDDPTADALGCAAFDPCPTPSGPPDAPALIAPQSPTREASIELEGTTGAGLAVKITGGLSSVPIRALSGSDGAFAATVELTPNRLNRLFAVVEDASGKPSAPAAVEVIQDSVPPFVYIDEPSDGATVLTDRVTVTGRVSDLLSGFAGLDVTVNGQPAAIAIGIGTNGTFERQEVPLALGVSTIKVVAADVVGNTTTREVQVAREEPPPGSDRLELVSGNGQAKVPIHTALPQSIVVRARKADGTALEGKLVTFKVVRSDGRLTIRPGAASGNGVMTLAVLTSPDGLASVRWTLGSDAGCGNNRVRATGAGLAGEVLFCASAAPGPAAQINIGTGNNQRGEAGAPVPQALRAWVSDGCNGVPGVPVTFRVARGGGKVDGADTITVPTGPTGHAQVSFVLGANAGNQAVEADFADNAGDPATFIAFALLRNEAKPTTFTGLVLDNTARPIQGAVCVLEVPGFEGVQARTSLDGRFTLEAPAAGPASLAVEGSFAMHVGGEGGEDVPSGSFPALIYEVTLVPNAENSLASPVLLPPLDPENAVVYDAFDDSDTVLSVKGIQGLEMLVTVGTTVTLLDGTRVGPGHPGSVKLSLNQVHNDKRPMPMPDGADPPFAWTLQPRGATFDPPLQIRYPNMAALPPGAIANFLSFNHDTGKFEVVSSGHVSLDGASIESDPGSGIITAGWGGTCPPYVFTGSCEKEKDEENSECDLEINRLDLLFAPGVERLNLTYSLVAAKPFAKLEVFRVGELSSPVFVDFSIPRAGQNIEYTQAGAPGWSGEVTVGPSSGKLIGPGFYFARISVANSPDFSGACSKSSLFKVEVHSIQLSAADGRPINKGDSDSGFSVNPGEGPYEIRAAVKLKKKDQSPVATAAPIEVSWTFTDPGDPDATSAESYEFAPPRRLGKRENPSAHYWRAHPDSAARSDDDFKLTAASQTLLTGSEQGTAKIVFVLSGVGGDDFGLKVAVKTPTATLAEQASANLVAVRVIAFNQIHEMQGLTHVSRNADRAKIQPYYSPAFVSYSVGAPSVISAALSVKYIGLFKDTATPQVSWAGQQAKQVTPWTLKYGLFAGSSGITEVPTQAELMSAEYEGVDVLLLVEKQLARVEIMKKAQAWAERIDSANSASQNAWEAAAGIPNHSLVAIHHYHPKYSLLGGDSATNEWPEWVRVTTYFGTYEGVDPDGGFVAGGGTFAGLADSTTGVATLPDGFPDPTNENTVVHEVGHATKSVFPRQDFGPLLDHSEAPGLMDRNGSLNAFTNREIKILRGYTQP